MYILWNCSPPAMHVFSIEWKQMDETIHLNLMFNKLISDKFHEAICKQTLHIQTLQNLPFSNVKMFSLGDYF